MHAIPVVMLCGPSGAGKSSFGKLLAAHLDVPLYSSDAWMVARHGRNPPRADFKALQDAVRADIWAEIDAGVRQGCGAVMDFGFWTRAGRKRSWERIAAMGALDIVIEITCDPEVARQRVLARTAAAAPDSLHIDEAALDGFAQIWEPLEDGEAHFSIDGMADHDEQMASYRALIRCGLV